MDFTIFPYLTFHEDENCISINIWSRNAPVRRTGGDPRQVLEEIIEWGKERDIATRHDGFLFWKLIDVNPQQMIEFRLTFEGSTDFS